MGKFIIKKAGEGYMFNLLANNGLIICTSQTYSSKSACKIGIESVRNNASVKVEDQTVKDYENQTNPKYEIYLDRAGEFRFRLKASNGEIIAASQGYNGKASCKNGIESIGKNAPEADVEDQDAPERPKEDATPMKAKVPEKKAKPKETAKKEPEKKPKASSKVKPVKAPEKKQETKPVKKSEKKPEKKQETKPVKTPEKKQDTKSVKKSEKKAEKKPEAVKKKKQDSRKR